VTIVSLSADLGALGELWLRLRGGAYPAFGESRLPSAGQSDEEALEDWPGGRLEMLDHIRRNPGEPCDTIQNLATDLRSRRPLLMAALFAPDTILLHIRKDRSAGSQGLVDAWVGMCWVAQAAWKAVTEDVPSELAADAALLRPLAARLRFLVLSEPMRWRGQGDEAWWGSEGTIMNRVFGKESWWVLVGYPLCQTDVKRDELVNIRA
jgi:hypothetical protein